MEDNFCKVLCDRQQKLLKELAELLRQQVKKNKETTNEKEKKECSCQTAGFDKHCLACQVTGNCLCGIPRTGDISSTPQPPTKEDWKERWSKFVDEVVGLERWSVTFSGSNGIAWLTQNDVRFKEVFGAFVSKEFSLARKEELEEIKRLAEERGYERGRKEGQMEGYTDGLKEGVKYRAVHDRYADEGTLGNSKKDLLSQLRTIIEGKKKDLLDECRECSEEKGHLGNTCGNYYAALQDILKEINKLENE